MKQELIKILTAVGVFIFASCNAGSDRSSTKDSITVPSSFDTMKTPVHPGMVDSTGTPRLRS